MECDTVIKINWNDTVYKIVKAHPDLLMILHDLGFEKIVKKGMLESVGRFMTLKQGASSKGITQDTIEKAFNNHQYTLEE